MKQHGEYQYIDEFADKIAKAFTAAGSDKSTYHAYHEPYAHILEGLNVSSFLEIGLFLWDTPTTDLYAWEQIFPNADIWGADIKQHLLFNEGRIRCLYIDQADSETFPPVRYLVGDKVDVILDDASHVYSLTINTFENMFDLVAPGGVYMIEDILLNGKPGVDWEQNVKELDNYFKKTGYNYEFYSTSTIDKCIDSVVLAIYN
jgi:hypothetical protein